VATASASVVDSEIITTASAVPKLNECPTVPDDVHTPIQAKPEKIKKYEQLQNIIIKDAPAVFLYNPNYLYWASKKVQGIETTKIVVINKIVFVFCLGLFSQRRSGHGPRLRSKGYSHWGGDTTDRHFGQSGDYCHIGNQPF